MSLNVEVLGHRVLILVDDVEIRSAGGIYMVSNEREKKIEQGACVIGTILDYGPTAWQDPALRLPNGDPWVNKGDKVYFGKYAGKTVKDPEDPDKHYQIINDEDIHLKIRN